MNIRLNYRPFPTLAFCVVKQPCEQDANLSIFRGKHMFTNTCSSSTFLLWKQLMQIVGQTWLNLTTLTCGSWSDGQHDLYFTVQWFCLISWRLFYVCTKKNVHHTLGLWIRMTPLWPQNKCRSLWPIFHGQVILPCILKTIWCMNIIIWNYESVWHDIWPRPDLYFMVQWFCVMSWKLLDVWTSYFGIMGQYDQTFDLKINVCHCDLYFMVQWFCLMSQRLFDG